MFGFLLFAVGMSPMGLVGLLAVLALALPVFGTLTTTVGVTFKVGNENISGATNTYTSDGAQVYDFVVPANTVNHELDVVLTLLNIKAIGMISDVDLVCKTNSTSTPQETIPFIGKKPIVWTPDNGQVIPFAGNLTKMYFTNAGSVDANVKLGFAVQQEP